LVWAWDSFYVTRSTGHTHTHTTAAHTTAKQTPHTNTEQARLYVKVVFFVTVTFKICERGLTLAPIARLGRYYPAAQRVDTGHTHTHTHTHKQQEQPHTTYDKNNT